MKNYSGIILVSGLAGSGKDTFADMLAEELRGRGLRVVRDMFAKYIKQYMKDYYGWDGITKDDKIRTKLQVLGTDIIKEKLNYTAFHARRLAEDFKIFEDDFDYFIVSDTRFRDEIYTMMASFPGKVLTVRIVRPELESKLTGEQKNHKSENDLKRVKHDCTIINSAGLDELMEDVKAFVDNYTERNF